MYYEIVYYRSRNHVARKYIKADSPTEAIRKSRLREIVDVLDSTKELYEAHTIKAGEG